MLYEDRIKDLSKHLRTHESPRELVRQSEAKRNQAPQSEENVCRDHDKCNLEKPPLFIAQGTQ